MSDISPELVEKLKLALDCLIDTVEDFTDLDRVYDRTHTTQSLSMEEVKKLRSGLDFTTRPEDKEHLPDSITIEWHIEDVLEQSDSITTNEQAREVLQRVLENHDANDGISWDTIDNEVELYWAEFNATMARDY